MLVPRPILTGASGKRRLIPTPSSDTERRHALAVDSKPTTMLPLAPGGKACFSAFIVNSVAIRPMLTACSDVVDPSPASTLMDIGWSSNIIDAAKLSHSLVRYDFASISAPNGVG